MRYQIIFFLLQPPPLSPHSLTMAHLSLTWACALLFTVTLLSVSCGSMEFRGSCKTIPDPWLYRVILTTPYFAKPFLLFFDNEQWYRSLLKSIGDNNSEEVDIPYVFDDGFFATLNLEQVKKLKERPEISDIIPDGMACLQ